MDPPELAQRIAAAAARLGVAAVGPLLVATLALFEPLTLASPSERAWLLPATAWAAAAMGGTAMVLTAGAALLNGAPPTMLRAGALGALTAGLAVIAVGSTALAPTAVAVRDVAAAGVIAGALLAGSSLVPVGGRVGAGSRVAVAAGVFVAAELALAATLLAPLPDGVAPWALAMGAALALAAALPAVTAGEAMLAGGLLALAIAREGTLEAAIGLAALGAASPVLAWRAIRDAIAGERQARVPVPELVHPFLPVDWALAGPPPTASLQAMPPRERPGDRHRDEDATRLMRELRGTIEELLETRRTVELQRAEIARASELDALTTVASRRAILERLRVEAAEARRYDHPIALVLLDIDGFGALNREYGLDVGDRVLREVALRLRLRVRLADALGRVGSDSFLAILPHTDERGAAIFSDALLRRLAARPIPTPAGELSVAVSIGIAFMRPGMELDDEEMLIAADEALASARAAGGNRIALDRRHGLVRLEGRRHDEPPSADESAG